MNKYQEAKIYILRSTQTQDVYIGSTTSSLNKRLTEHKADLTSFTNKKKNYRTSFEIVKFDDVTIEILELFPCNNKQELEVREGFHIRNDLNSVNICIAGRTRKDYYNDNKTEINEKKRNYYKLNHSRLIARKRELYHQKKLTKYINEAINS